MRLGNLFQQSASCRMRVWKVPVTEGAICDHGDAVFLTPWNNGVFDGTFLQMVKNLIAGTMSAVGDGFGRSEVGRIEVPHAPGTFRKLPSALRHCSSTQDSTSLIILQMSYGTSSAGKGELGIRLWR